MCGGDCADDDTDNCAPSANMVRFILMNKVSIGRYIVERRDALAISQTRLAEMSGVSVHTLSNLETGSGNVTLNVLLKVTGVLGLRLSVGD